MPVRTLVTRTRPSELVPWYLHAREKNEYIKATYIDTGNLIKTISASTDGLTQIVECIWSNKTVYNQSLKDPIINADNDVRNAYCEASGIVEESIIEVSNKKFK